MADQQLTNILAEMARANARNGPLPSFQRVSGLSQAILARAGLQEPYKSTEELNKKDVRGPSVVNRVLDVLSRPLYGALNVAKGHIERNKDADSLPEALVNIASSDPIATGEQSFSDFWEGFSGRAKTTGRDLIKTTGLDEDLPGPAQAAIGFGIDVLGDPLTYVGGLGLASKVGKGAKTSTEALKGLEEGTARTAQTLSEEISKRAAQQADDLNIIPKPPIARDTAGKQLALPSAEEFKSNARLESLAPGPPKVTDKLSVLEPGNPAYAKRAGGPPYPKVTPIDEIKALNAQIAKTKSPVAQNLLKTQIAKLKAGIKPADILSEARVDPSPFPAVSIGQRWIDSAIETAQKFLSKNRLKNINHVGQSNLYNSILSSASKVRKDRRAFHVLQMLRVAEDEILRQGRHLVDAEGISVRLSDIANMMGGPKSLNSNLVDGFRKARPSQQIEDLKAYTTPQVVAEVLDPVIQTAEKIAPALKALPESQTKVVGTEISKALSKIAEQAGASSREAKTAKEFIDELFSVDRDKLYSIIDQEARNLVRQTSSGILNPRTMHKISEETYKALGANAKLLGRQTEQNKVVEGIMTKFATWWGASDLKPFSREYIDTARNVAAAFSEAMKPLVSKTTPTQRKIAFSVAQGKHTPGSPQEEALATQFKYLIERLMGTHGITSNAESVVLRSGTLLKELNSELPKSLKLIDSKGTDTLGRNFDYTNGNWMHSWKEWKIDEPAEALYQLTRSLQIVTRKNSMWDDAAVRWGMPIKGAEYQYPARGIDRLQGTYFPKQIADQLSNLQRQLDRDVFKTPHKSIELFDKVQRMWKTGVTIYSPSHHIRNLNGDIYLAALDGVVSPRPYAIATKVLHAFPSRYKDLESVFNIMDPALRDRALRARPGNVVLTTKAGEKVTAEQLYQAAESQGLFIRAMHIEDLMGDASPAFGTFGAKFRPFGGKVYDAATRTSELRDHWVRLAHFADILSKSRQPLRVAIEQAGRRVKKFHPDGMDLTGFEQNVLRRVIPFYSWMRKATPLVIEGAIMRPHISLAFPKAMANMQLATGIESEGPGDPFPMDQMFPDWIKEKGIGPILQPGSGIGRDETWRGEAPGYTIMNPTNPLLDQIQQIGSPAKTLLSSLTPAARIPMELLQGQTSLGIPLENVEGGVPGHLAQQIPTVGIGARLTGMTRDNEPWNPEQLINWLTAAGITGTGPYQAQAQTEIRQLLTEMAKKNRGDYR